MLKSKRDARRQDGAAVGMPPPCIYLLHIVGAMMLHAMIRHVAIPIPHTLLRVLAGAVLGIAGISFLVMGLSLFHGTGQDPRPWTPTPEMIVTGIYRYTRNPMYLGMGLVQLGMGIGLNHLWIALLTIPSMIMVHYRAVLPEETYLAKKFGQQYLRYQASVRRWI